MSSNKNPNSRGARGAGSVKGRNSNNPSPNLARDPSRRPTTSPLDITSATHDADSPRNPEGDNMDTPVTPPLELTDIQNSEQQPTANESVEQLVYKLTTPTPPTLTTLTTVPTPRRLISRRTISYAHRARNVSRRRGRLQHDIRRR